MTNGLPSVELAGQELTIRAPGAFSLRLDLYWSVGRNLRRGAAACLGQCLVTSEAPLSARLTAFSDTDILNYGGSVIDELVARGCSWPQISDASTIAWALLSESLAEVLESGLATPTEVEDVENFSGAPGAAGSA